MVEHCLVDGRAARTVPADDRGLAYGDGVFRTLRVAAGVPVAWSAHMARLAHDCDRLHLAMPEPDRLIADAAQLFAGQTHGILKIMVTRGSAGRGYAPDTASPPRRIVSAHPLPAHARGPGVPLRLARCGVTLAVQPQLAGVKHLNRLEQVLARAECDRQGVADSLMCDAAGFVVSTTMRNLLFRDGDGRWYTPRLTRAGIIGATRERLRAGLAQAGVTLIDTDITPATLGAFEAAIACNSVGGAVAVTHIDGYVFAASEAAAEDCRALLEAG